LWEGKWYMLDRYELSQEIKIVGKAIGFQEVGISLALPSFHFPFYERWLEKGYHGKMMYLKKHEPIKKDPRHLFPQAKSIISCALKYKTYSEWGDEYHVVMKKKLKELFNKIQEFAPEVKGYVCCDTAPLLEKSFAQCAGLGWIGKNTLLIHPHYGSHVFLGEILINIELERDPLLVNQCGSCQKCVEACPTKAFMAPYELDARRCISYEAPGCEVCQEVCPWNKEKNFS